MLLIYTLIIHIMTQLSVNVNKIATLRNARGNNMPNLEFATSSILDFGADGITIHPRPDRRHITEKDVFSLSQIVKNRVEFNIEGYPSKEFIDLVLKIKPNQVTLVPDKPNVLTSLEGWNTIKDKILLTEIIKELRQHGIRVSVFIHPNIDMVEGSAIINADRIELFTGTYAYDNTTLESYVNCSKYANKIGLGVNAGHDLDLNNLPLFIKKMPFLNEVSIGHALISEALFLGLKETINRYKKILE
jgi:pyridoxine 5-phosphate synthase